MKEHSNTLFYKAFSQVHYPCFWVGQEDVFWCNEAADTCKEHGHNKEEIRRLLYSLWALCQESTLHSEHAKSLKTTLQTLGVSVLFHPRGLFATCQEEPTLSLPALSYGVREPVSDLFSSVQALSRKLEECPLAEKDEHFLNECLRSIQEKEYTLLRLAYNLETYNLLSARPSSQKITELHSFTENLCKKAQRAFTQNGVPLSAELEKGLFAVKADSRLLGHALCNLLRNGLQFSREGNEVTVRLKQLQNRVLLSVCDKGLGIQNEALAHVFTPYYSAHPHLDSPEKPGLGLGLPLVRCMAQAAGGVVTIESTFGKGTCVQMALPLCTYDIQDLKSHTTEEDDLLSSNQSPIYIQLCGYTPLPIL